jgi:hypothetical protein
MSQTPRLTRRARQLTASLLANRPADADGDLAAGRLQKLAAAGGTGMLPFSGSGEGAIYLQAGRVIYAESERTPWPADAFPGQASELPPLAELLAIRTATEPVLDAVLELFTSQQRYAKFRPSRQPAAKLTRGISVDALLTEIRRRQRLMNQLSALLTPDTAVARNPGLRNDSIRISAWQWALLIRAGHSRTPRDLAWDLGRSVFGTTIDVYRLVVMRLLSAPGQAPERGLALMSFARAAPVRKGNTMPVIHAGSATEGAV